ncbi:MAG: hypothetical protein HGB00_09000 [Chlorobiaceae bacterium]|nr:hypothetical protein [Chlorobiaceae bacterium]
MSQSARGDNVVPLDDKPRIILSAKEVGKGDLMNIYVYSPGLNKVYYGWELYCDGVIFGKSTFYGQKSNIICIRKKMVSNGDAIVMFMVYDKSMQPILFQKEDVKVLGFMRYWQITSLLIPFISAIIAYIMFYAQENIKKKIEDVREMDSFIYQISVYVDEISKNIKLSKTEKIKSPLFIEYPYESKWAKILVDKKVLLLIGKINKIKNQWDANLIDKDDALNMMAACVGDIELIKKKRNINTFSVKMRKIKEVWLGDVQKAPMKTGRE